MEGVHACKPCTLEHPFGMSAAALPKDCDVPQLMEALRDAGARILPEVWHRASMRYFCTFSFGSALKPIPSPQVRADAASAAAALFAKGDKSR